MNNDLIIMIFDKEEGAMIAKGALETRRHSQLLGVSNAVIVTRNMTGEVAVQLPRHLPRQSPNHLTDPSTQMPDLLVSAIFVNPPEENLKMLVDAGMDERFIKLVRSELEPGTSMIFYYIRQDSLVDTLQVLEALNQFNGKLTHTTVPPPVEAAILESAGYE